MTRKIIYISLFLLGSTHMSLYCQSAYPMVIGEVNHREAYIKMPHGSNEYTWYLVNDTQTDSVPLTTYTSQDIAIWKGLNPGQSYTLISTDYELSGIDCQIQTLPDWQYHTEAPNIRFVTGSCSYINEHTTDRWNTDPYGDGHEIYQHMTSERADFNLWLGDNIYLRPSDYSSPSGIAHRYEYARSNDKLQMLLSIRPNYAVWDDHDAGPNNSVHSFFYIDETRNAFMKYWPRAKYGSRNGRDIRWIQQVSDVVFIGLDNRSYRTYEDSPTPQVLGKEQIDWLVEQVKFYNRASFIVVAIGGQVLHSEAIYENLAQYPEERDYLLGQLASTGYQNIVFLTGDRHHSEISQEVIDNVRFTDVTVSPLTSGPSTVVQSEENKNRVSGFIDVRNYAIVEIEGGDAETRILKVTYKNTEGEEIMAFVLHSL